jgi:hypothetical protein
MHSVAQAGQPIGFKTRRPALQRPSIFSKQVGDLLATVVSGNQQQPVQSIIIPRLIGPSNFLFDGQSQDVGISNFKFSHESASIPENSHQCNAIMREIYIAMFGKD